MNRKIKFRAWHKNDKSMCQNVTTDLLNQKYLEFMQYTGLKDKHDTEIYDGDIVKLTERNYTDCSKEELESIKTSIQLVAYDYGTFGLRKNTNGTGLKPLIFLLGTDYSIEVIGNIHENPELLEGEGNEC